MPGFPARCSLFTPPPGLSHGRGGRCGRICSCTADRSRRGRRQRCPLHALGTPGDAFRDEHRGAHAPVTVWLARPAGPWW